MHRALSSRWLRNALRIGDRAALAQVPVYLCPSLSAASSRHRFAPAGAHQKLPYGQRRCVHVETTPASESAPPPSQSAESSDIPAKQLPSLCSGCGALTQTTDAGQAGYFDLNRKTVREYLASENDKEAEKRLREEDSVVEAALQSLGDERLAELGLDPRVLRHGEELESDRAVSRPATQRAPLCDRCHTLIHHHAGTPIFHPTIDALRETIEESPFKNNHIYHIIDAADFPMSFIPKLHLVLDANLKHRNRRNKAGRYYKDRKFDMYFIITRSDLLAPQKEMVDSMMPYLREVLRRALGKFGKLVTLGNVSCVSAERGWWTKALKDRVYERGGAGWMVGKVNVGKSQLFQAVFPKGTTANISSKHPFESSLFAKEEDSDNGHYLTGDPSENDAERMDVDALLPPARAETNFPEMPTVSSLPGTTASPIRIPFGNGKGELIDLPGVARSELENYVKPEHRQSLIMQHRMKPPQHSLQYGQSLLLGGLIRITPTTPGLIYLVYNFTSLPEHKTATEKAVEFQAQSREAENVPNLAVPDIASKIECAGSFQLRHDVTKERAGPLTRKDAAGLKVESLPWRVLATDILIEGCGWVEIVAQVRTRHLFEGCSPSFIKEELEPDAEPADAFAAMEKVSELQSGRVKKPKDDDKPPEPNWPVIEVYTPEGKFIGSRLPMNAWLMNKPRKRDLKARPRKSMKGAKKAAKAAKRAAAGAA